MKKKLCLASSVLTTIFLAFLFMPVIYTKEYYKNIAPGVGHAVEAWEKGVNVFELNPLFVVFILIFAIASIIVLFVQYLGTKNNISPKINFLPLGTGLIFIVASIARFSSTVPNGSPAGTAQWGKYGFYEYAPNFGFYIAIILIVISALLSFLIAIGKVKDAAPMQKASSMPQKSNIDELKEYKELFDSGVITEEEFNAKKKQLLNL